ncbi:MAG: ABC transporter substrate-binding protein [Planctomycetota bacterium]|nr:ABC transporter substrate-binding protein [Planctomycetota bacterium]MDA1212640.1 ABC transporter substrate-binding protein [Planctomycetota bacterium]
MFNKNWRFLIILAAAVYAGTVFDGSPFRGVSLRTAGAQNPADTPAETPDAEVPADPTTPSAAEEEFLSSDAPKLRSELTLPSDAQLLNGPKNDWVVFYSQEDTGPLNADSPIPPDIPEYALVVEPLYPRPGTLDSIRARINERFDSETFVDRALLEELPIEEGLLYRNLIYQNMEADELKQHTINRIRNADVSTIEQTPPDSRLDLPELIIDFFRKEAFRSTSGRKSKDKDGDKSAQRDLTDLLKGNTFKKILIEQVEKLPAARYQELRKTVVKDAEELADKDLSADERREMRRQRQDDRRQAAQELRDLKTERRKIMVEERDRLDMLSLVLPNGGEQPEVRIRIRYVKEIVYHEDQMLLRVDQLIQEQQLGMAFEMLYILEKQSPQWPGLTNRKANLILAESIAKRNASDLVNALVLVEEVYRLDPQTAGLSEQAGRVVDDLIQSAYADADERRARHYHRRLKDLFPDHAVVVRWETEWSSQSEQLIADAQAAFSARQYADATDIIRRASRVWPNEPQLPSAYRKIVNRNQRLEVGVLRRFDGEPHLPWRTIVQESHRRLLEVDLFEVTAVNKQTRFASRYFERWDPTNLGRETEFWLRRGRRIDESLPLISATAVADELHRRVQPDSPDYDERLASYLKSVTVKSPFELSVKFSRIPFQSEALFRFPITAESSSLHAPMTAAVTSSNSIAGAQTVQTSSETVSEQVATQADQPLAQRFVLHVQSDERVIYRRAIPEPDDLPEYHMAEISVQRFPDSKTLLQALLRGEISMITNLEKPDVAILQNDDRFTVGKYGLPVTHLIQFHPESEPLRNVQVRRALAYGINREKILQDLILKGADPAWGRLISAPFSSQHDAYSKLISTRPYDLTMSLSLLFSAKRQFPDGLPVLKMACEPDTTLRAAAERIARDWSRMGIQVELLPIEVDLSATSDDGSPPWDIVYRTAVVEDPIMELWPLVCQQPHAAVASLSFLPDWLRQEFIELENAADFKTAIGWMHRLHEHLQNEAVVVPLWETDEFYLYRKNIRGVPTQPIWGYQDVESWALTPWYAVETP